MLTVEKFGQSNWIDIATGVTWFGIKGMVGGKWHHLAESGKALVFANPDERDAKIKELSERFEHGK